MINNPIPEIWSDIHQDIVGDAQGALKKVINEDSVRTSIDNILGTAQGERIMLPEFASNLKSLIFEPMNERLLDRYLTNVKETIEKWDDRVIVAGIDSVLDPDKNYVSLTVRFTIKSYSETFSHTVTVTA